MPARKPPPTQRTAPALPKPAEATRFAEQLLAWYAQHQRDLPWRRKPDPYAVWVSEVMLQQTQVATVKPYFERWMRSFPTLRALADAEEAEVLAHWQGLGYYSRARSLLRGARHVCSELAGQIPSTPDALQQLPGVGPYTAGAIASIAFERDAPLVDGNVGRVLARAFGLEGPLQAAPLKTHVWDLAATLIPPGRARDFNQALMELGALVCTPQKPQCAHCPVRSACVALETERVAELPTPAVRPAITAVRAVSVVVERGGRWFLLKLPDTAPRWAGLYRFPNRELASGETLSEAAEICLLETTGWRAKANAPLHTLKHSVTRYRIELSAVPCTLSAGRLPALPPTATGVWVEPATAESLAMPAPDRRILRWLANNC